MKIKALSILFVLVATVGLNNASFAQKAQTVKLVQTPGKFTTSQITLEEGEYVFEVSNEGVDHEVGLVVVPKGSEKDQSKFIKEAFVTKAVATGKTEKTNVVNLKKGEYSFFCPLNPTPQYTIIVE